MLTDMKTLLDIAEKKGCAIPAFNVYNAETALGAIFAAEEANSCVILQMYSRLFSNFEAQFMAPSILEAARNAKVKVAFHLDHGANDEVVTKALRWGCTGVMRDASTSPFEENVAILKNVGGRAHAVGVSVEGELGHIGVAKDGVSTEYTKVDEAKRFVEETGVDALAIMVGTAHGHYKQAPVLAIHSRFYLLSDDTGAQTRVILGSINLTAASFDEHHNQLEEVLVFDNSPLYANFMQRFKNDLKPVLKNYFSTELLSAPQKPLDHEKGSKSW